MRTIHVLPVAVLTFALLAGCQAAPRARPVKMGPVDAGAGSVEAARRQLQGTWQLVELDVYSPSGQKTPVQASGRLTYDDHGNLAMRGTITGSAQVDPSALNFEGRVAIDPDAHTIKLTGVTAASADDKRVDPKLDASKVRYYEFEGDLLKTTLKDSAGTTTATATWKRAQ
jgi:hypothetical protein